MKNRIYFAIIACVVVVITSCSTSNCVRKNEVPAMPNNSNVDKNLKISDGDTKPKTVYVFKPDGSLQCGMGQAIPLSEMAQELNGIKIYSQANKGDGLMHIQVCGSSTGQINIFEISQADLTKAIKKGFKTWTNK